MVWKGSDFPSFRPSDYYVFMGISISLSVSLMENVGLRVLNMQKVQAVSGHITHKEMLNCNHSSLFL